MRWCPSGITAFWVFGVGLAGANGETESRESSIAMAMQVAAPMAPAPPAIPGMVALPGGVFMMGSDDREAWPAERPAHLVRLDPFWIDETEVTNAQFRAFVEATGYVTTAERKPDWERSLDPPAAVGLSRIERGGSVVSLCRSLATGRRGGHGPESRARRDACPDARHL